jgi:hypothetical protein
LNAFTPAQFIFSIQNAPENAEALQRLLTTQSGTAERNSSYWTAALFMFGIEHNDPFLRTFPLNGRRSSAQRKKKTGKCRSIYLTLFRRFI